MVAQFTAVQVVCQRGDGLWETRSVVEHDESFHAGAAVNKVEVIGGPGDRAAFVVTRDTAAQHHTSAVGEMIQCDIQDVSADIIKNTSSPSGHSCATRCSVSSHL